MSADPFRGQIAVITGGASGLGAAMAQAFAARGARLVLTDIDADGLAAQRSALGEAVVAAEIVDVADREAMAAFAADVLERFGAPRILVNNAGVSVTARSIDTSPEDWAWITGINVLGVCYGVALFGQAMEASSGRAHIVNIASAAGLNGLFSMPAYSMTKCAVYGLSEAMRFEFDDGALMTHVICPGFVHTGIVSNGRAEDAVDRALGDTIMDDADARGRKPADVARAVVEAIDTRRFRTLVYEEAKMMRTLRHLPDFMRSAAFRKLKGQIARRRAAAEQAVDEG